MAKSAGVALGAGGERNSARLVILRLVARRDSSSEGKIKELIICCDFSTIFLFT
jgi:hypothetical protein